MIAAKEAQQLTVNTITNIAKEFLLNEASVAIREACDRGLFRTSVNVPIDKCDCKRLGSKLEYLLKKDGYQAQFLYSDDGPRVECRVQIDWSKMA